MPDPLPPGRQPPLSIVVVAGDGWDRTFELLLGLVGQARGVGREVIVVDHASSDETRQALPLLEGLEVVRCDAPIGLARAQALGAGRARAPAIAFLRTGLRPDPGWLDALLVTAAAEPEAIAFGSTLLDADGRPLPEASPGLESAPLDGLLVRARAYREAGGLDEALRRSATDAELAAWMAGQGERVVRVRPAVLRVLDQSSARVPEAGGALGTGPAPSEPVEPQLLLEAADAPTPGFPLGTAVPPEGVVLEAVAMLPHHDGTYELEVQGTRHGRPFKAWARPPMARPRDPVKLKPVDGGPSLKLSRGALLACLAQGYDLVTAARRARAAAGDRPLRVAFTLLRADLLGGGAINLFRWVNWLAERGAEVAVYSGTLPPAWTSVNARFHPVPLPWERYAAITEEIVVVASAIELPLLLRTPGMRDRLVFHLCQGAEEFHYGEAPPADPPRANAAFELLHAIPVGRLVVSPHLQAHFEQGCRQRSQLVVNGVDLETYCPGPRPRRPGHFTVMTSGSPDHPLKGARYVEEALARLAARHPGLAIHLVQVCGAPPERPPPPGRGFTRELRHGLCAAAMREQYLAADAYVNASWYEGFGLPSVEAMACGTPLVQARNGGLAGLLADGRDCLEVPVADPEAIAGALERLLTDLGLAARLAEGGMATAAGLSQERQREAVCRLFSRLGALPPRRRVEPGATRPTFSVLVPSYNQAHLVEATLESLRAQTDPDWEALVVDDGSSDATPEVLARWARRDPRLRVFRQPNGGVAAALNRGLAEARGEWICWLSSDDLWRPDKLASHREVMARDAGARFLHTGYELLHHASGQLHPSGIRAAEFIPPIDQQSLRFLQVNYVNGITVALHRSVFELVGRFDEALRYGQDFDLWLRASARVRLQYDDRVTAITRIHPGQGTAQFSQAGIFDSGRAAAAFLSRHGFAGLFPSLELSQPDQALRAVNAALQVALHPGSFITVSGFATLLFEQARAWLAGAPPAVRGLVQPRLAQAAPALRSAEARQAVLALAAQAPEAFRPGPVDLLGVMTGHAERMARAGDVQGQASLRRYLEMVARLPRPEARPGPSPPSSGPI